MKPNFAGTVRAAGIATLLAFVMNFAAAQQAAAPAAAKAAEAPTPAAAGATAPDAAAPKAAPALPAGSTAAVGWNVPPKWSEVEQKPQYASVPGHETNVLIEDSGQWWRSVRNGPVTFYGGIALLVMPALLLIFYAIKGPFKLEGPLTGKLIERFNSLERMAHWTMALSFVAMAITGITILFGKYFLLPVLGAAAFSWITTIGKNIHNFLGPLFMFSLIVMFVVYVKDNWIKGDDITWLVKLGGITAGKTIPSGRFSGGEKVWFWLAIVVLGTIISASGLIMLFPNWNTGRDLMADANLFHAIGALTLAVASLSHIYMGTIGTEGALKGMREGYVDETWARENHELWYNEVKAGKRPEKVAGTPQPAAGDD